MPNAPHLPCYLSKQSGCGRACGATSRRHPVTHRGSVHGDLRALRGEGLGGKEARPQEHQRGLPQVEPVPLLEFHEATAALVGRIQSKPQPGMRKETLRSRVILGDQPDNVGGVPVEVPNRPGRTGIHQRPIAAKVSTFEFLAANT